MTGSQDERQFDDDDCGCDEAIARIYEYLDGELTVEVEARVRAHLVACHECEPAFEHERVFLEFVAQRARLVAAPPALRRRILDQLMAQERRRAGLPDEDCDCDCDD
jgi:anti-sigma factor (TIGR02949 family)